MELQWSIGAAVVIGIVGGLVGLVAFIGGVSAGGELVGGLGFVMLLLSAGFLYSADSMGKRESGGRLVFALVGACWGSSSCSSSKASCSWPTI